MDSEFLKQNKKMLLDRYSNSNDLSELENTLNNISNLNSEAQNNVDLIEIKQVIMDRIDNIKNKSLKDTLEETKRVNSIVSDFNIIETTKEINDEDNYGFRNDVAYLKVNDGTENKLFEVSVEYLDNLKQLFGDKELLSELSKEDILDKIKMYAIELEKNNVDTKNSDIENEINNIYDPDIKSVFMKNIESVKKERELINDYNKKNNNQDGNIIYSLNSKGERIYYVEDRIIKFVGPQRDMYFLDSNGNELIGTDEIKDTKEKSEYSLDIPNDLNSMSTSEYKFAIENIFNKIYGGEQLEEYDITLIEKFLTLCVFSKEEDIPFDLYEMYSKYYEYLYEYEDYYNENIETLFKEKIGKEKSIEKEKDNKFVKKLEYNNKSAFINITLMIICIIVTILFILYYFIWVI